MTSCNVIKKNMILFYLYSTKCIKAAKFRVHIWVKRTRMDIMQHSVTFSSSTSELKYANFKTDPNKSKMM